MDTRKRPDVTNRLAGKLIAAVACAMLGSACVSTSAPGHFAMPRASAYGRHGVPIYIAPNRGIWLSPSDNVHCDNGLPLVCHAGTGRLSTSWCYCPAR